MAQQGTSTVDPLAGTAVLDLHADDVHITTYRYADGTFTLSQRETPAEFKKGGFGFNFLYILNWYEMVRSMLPPAPMVWCEYQSAITEDTKSIKTALTFGDVTAIDATYSRETEAVTFEPRSDLKLTPKQFWHFVQTLERVKKIAAL